MAWFRGGGLYALEQFQALGITPTAADYPPALSWEHAVWRVYEQCQRQVRVSFGGLIGLDYNVFLPLIARQDWHHDTALALLGAIENAVTSKDVPVVDTPDGQDDEDGHGT